MAATELSAETRARILEAAWQRVRESGPAGVSVKAVAAAAGVSRQLVYFHFRNRAGLLLAMTRHHDRASGFAERVAAAAALEPVADLEALLRAWLAYLPEIQPTARALEAAYITGDDGGEAWVDRMGDLHAVLHAATDRVAAAGRLRDGWTAGSAADWAWAAVQPARREHLVLQRGWAPAAYADRTVAALLAELVVPVTAR